MALSWIDQLLWLLGFVQTSALLFVLLYCRRARTMPWFTAFVAFGVARTICLFLTFRLLGRGHDYFLIYWSAAGIDLLLQLAVIYEVAKTVFYRHGSWVTEASRRFLWIAPAAPLIGFVLAATMQPAATSALDVWDARANLFMTTTIIVLSGGIMAVSRQLGLSWRTRITWFMWGLLVWSLSSFVGGSLHAYWRTVDDFGALENIAQICYLLVTTYWIGVFWVEEPKLVQMPADARKDLESLHKHVHYQR